MNLRCGPRTGDRWRKGGWPASGSAPTRWKRKRTGRWSRCPLRTPGWQSTWDAIQQEPEERNSWLNSLFLKRVDEKKEKQNKNHQKKPDTGLRNRVIVRGFLWGLWELVLSWWTSVTYLSSRADSWSHRLLVIYEDNSLNIWYSSKSFVLRHLSLLRYWHQMPLNGCRRFPLSILSLSRDGPCLSLFEYLSSSTASKAIPSYSTKLVFPSACFFMKTYGVKNEFDHYGFHA